MTDATDKIRQATQTVEELYKTFMKDVIVSHVIHEREKVPLSEKTGKKIKQGFYVDPRAVRLMVISGKGGIAQDPKKQDQYDQFTNVTLLDHLLSVVRGALLFLALNLTAMNPEIEKATLRKKLATAAVIAFLHDIDKILEINRNDSISYHNVDEVMHRYGIHHFFKTEGISLSSDQLLHLIEKVEATQSHRHHPGNLPPRDMESLPRYVRLADQLDGIWLSTDVEHGGIAGIVKMLERLNADQSLLLAGHMTDWRELNLFDPHHPFLLDELQRWISLFSLRISGIPPLIEVHQDGCLFMLLPGEHFDEIVEKALDRFASKLPFNLELNVSNRGVPALFNGSPNLRELMDFIKKVLTQEDFAKLFLIQSKLLGSVLDHLDTMLSEINLMPRLQKIKGNLVSLYSFFDEMNEAALEYLFNASCLALLLNLKVDASAKTGIPNYDQRESELLNCLPISRPQWIDNINPGIADSSRRTVTALWATSLSLNDTSVKEIVWGASGLLRGWLEGEGQRPGMKEFISGKEQKSKVAQEVKRRFAHLLKGEYVNARDEKGAGRCLFTDEPVSKKETLRDKELYEVNVSAFSGREGRLESLTSEKPQTNVSYCSRAEHKFRKQVHQIQGGKPSGTPTLVSIPPTSGLFGGLAISDDKNLGAMSIYDLNRLEIKKGNVIRGGEVYQSRYRMARLESIPEKLKDQVNMLQMFLKAARRIGRSLHIFKGLPVRRPEFFYFDAMHRVLENLIGAKALRLEQIPMALDRLELAQFFLTTPGLGHDVLKQYSSPNTRFGAICLAWCKVRDKLMKGNNSKTGLVSLLPNFEQEYHHITEAIVMTNEPDGALVRLGREAARIQKTPIGYSSTNEELLVFNLSLEAVNEARRIGQEDTVSLIHAVAGWLETNLTRKGKAAAKEWRNDQSLFDGCLAFSELFVKDVWIGVMKNHSPTQKSRQIFSSIYRMAFLQASRQKSARKGTAVKPDVTPQNEKK